MKTRNTPLQIALQWASVAVLVASVLIIVASWRTLPDRVPGHYNALGEVDRWGSKYELIFLPAVSVGMFLLISLAERHPGIWNMPVQPTAENTERLYSAAKSMLAWLKLDIMLIFGYMTSMVSLARSLSPAFLPLSLGAVFGTLAYYIWRMVAIDRRTKRVIRIDSEVTRLKDAFPVSAYWYGIPLFLAIVPFVFAYRDAIPGAWWYASIFAMETLSFTALHFANVRVKSVVYSDDTDVNMALNRYRVRGGTRLCLFWALNASICGLLCFSMLRGDGYRIGAAPCIVYAIHIGLAFATLIAHRRRYRRLVDAVLGAGRDA